MNDGNVKSCWNVTAWALAGFATIMLVTYFVSNAERGDMVAATLSTNS